MQDSIPAVRAINLRCFIEGVVDAGQHTHVNNGTPANPFPNGRSDIQWVEPFYSGKEADGFDSEEIQHIIDNAIRSPKLVHNADHYHHRDKVGKVADGLHNFFEFGQTAFIDNDRQNNGCRESNQEVRCAQGKRVFQQPEEIWIRKKCPEML